MKQSDLDSHFQKLNHINLTEQESSESYQQIISRVNTVKKGKNLQFIINRTITTFATIIVLIGAGWFLHDILNPSINQQGHQPPSVVEDDRDEEQLLTEVDDGDFIPIEKRNSCVDSSVEPTSNSILVYFECQEFEKDPYPVKAVLRDIDHRETVESRIEYAIQELIKGPTKEEMEKGLYSIFKEETADLLYSIELQDSGYLLVDFIDFSKIIPNGSASAASLSMMETLNTTIAQFEEVELVEYQFDGSCEDFYGWIQVGPCMSHEMNDYRMELEVNNKELLLERSEVLFELLMMKDWEKFANFISNDRGLVYSPYSNVGDSDDLIFTKEEVEGFGEDKRVYSWSWDQSGAEFKATPNDFIENLLKTRDNYVYEYDEITYNDSDIGTMINTIHDIYPNAIYVEYLDEPDRDSLDWYKHQAIRFVYEEIDNEWYLIALVRGAFNP